MKIPTKRGNLIPDEHEVVRHVPYQKIIFDEQENIIGIFPHAYALRKDEPQLSVDWLDYYDGTRDEKLKAVLQGLQASKGIGKKSALALGNVMAIKTAARNASSINLRISYAPNGTNKAHSLIHNINNDELQLLEALATEGFADIRQVRSI
ncbi:hypothetical protein ICN19_04880 [Polynucleobacter sp. AP-Capit-er-40B-B4]|uniref:hypothetical protein n=1 Tax=Polynucleobacter sp. AP-Capit-er-40B-B4 TaxID=2576927 RepID=UPI001C0AB42A|nr:hypothetical protein [Polynucleobacter sp. AP-Capit-er-40B-B4]MBU3581345.1 hypothetical protein [Polynucleobacter sp. AP-Capit-er-40B-B4]